MKKIKSRWITFICVIAVSIAMMFGNLAGFSGIAWAAGDISDEYGARLHEIGRIPAKVSMGDNFELPAVYDADSITLTVKDPSGLPIQNIGGDENVFEATKLGNYTATYKNEIENIEYTYTIRCYSEHDYFIYVKDGGSTIPTYIKSGETFTIPDFYLAYTDDNGKTVECEEDVSYTAVWGGSETAYTSGSAVTATLGNVNLTLKAVLKGSKTFSEQFTVNCQTAFNDIQAPVLNNLSSVPSSGSINAKVTLPVASASDDYDSNVQIVVTVKDPDGNNVKEAVIDDETGYRVSDSSADALFDNDVNVTFYPSVAGTYTVSYQAKDDAGNASAEHTYKVVVSDKTGPVITSIEDNKIPTVWGRKTVVSATETLDQPVVVLPVPEFVDNSDAKNDIIITATIKNPSSKAVARFEMDYGDYMSGGKSIAWNDTSSYSKYLNDNYTIFFDGENGGLTFAFYYFNDEAWKAGDWTIEYSLKDTSGNGGYGTSRTTYTINVSDDEFEDKVTPTISDPALPEYMVLGREGVDTFTVPTIVVSDNKDSRLTEEYYLSKDAGNIGSDDLKVESGEVLNIVEADGIFYLEKEDGKKLSFTADGKVYIKYSATDDAGNVSKLYKDKEAKVLYAIDVYVADAAFGEESNIDFDIYNHSENKISEELNHIVAGSANMQNVGGFTVTNIKTKSEFIGFELSVTDAKGNALDDVTSYVFFNNDGDTLYVRDISFNPATAGEYFVNIRIIDALDSSYTYVTKFIAETDPNEDSFVFGDSNKAAAWDSSSAKTYSSYMLQRKSASIKGSESDNYIYVFKVNGGKFSLLGYEFTPITKGFYSITEYAVKEADAVSDEYDFSTSENKITTYSMTATGSDDITFDIYGSIDAYLGDRSLISSPSNSNRYGNGDGYYLLDPIVAYSDNQNYEVTVKYTDPDGNTKEAKKVYARNFDAANPVEGVDEDANIISENGNQVVYVLESQMHDDVEKDEDGDPIKDENGEYNYLHDYWFTGRFAIILDQDGTYTITVYAGDKSKTYTTKVGDVTAPQFEFVNKNVTASKNSATLGNSFSFHAIEIVSDDTDDHDDITVEYKLTDPNKSVQVSGSMTYTEYLKAVENGYLTASKGDYDEYSFSKSGDYIVTYTVKDKVGNSSSQTYTITVSTATSKTPTSLTMLSTVLIIVGVLLIAGVVVYLIRFRKRKA